MADPKDIRRQVGDVQPSIFVDPGVPDTSMAQTVGALGQIGMEVDAQLAKKNFAESVETLRSQYLTQPSAQEATMSPVADDDGGDGFVPTAMDNKAISDFGKVLDTHAQAAVQGKRSQDAFRIAAERLYRVAISKRPGLAREFRQVAEGFLGFDVVGASVEIAAQQDKEWMKSMADAAKSKAEQEGELIKRQREQWEKFYPESAFVPDEQWAAYTANKMPHFLQMSQAMSSADAAVAEGKLLDLQGKKSSEADERFYISQMDAIRAGFDTTIDTAFARASVPDESGAKLIDSPEGMRQVMTGLRTQLLQSVSKVDQAVAGRDVSAETKAKYNGFIEATLTKLDKTLALENTAEFMQRSIEIKKAQPIRALLDSDPSAAVLAAADDLYSDVVMDRIIADNGKTVALQVAKVITGAMPPNHITKVAARSTSQLIASIWKDGSKTPPDPMATSRAAQDIATMLSKFYLQDDSNFRPQDFTSWNGSQGILPVLTTRAKIIGPSLSEEERGEIVAQGAAAAGNSTIRLASLLAKKSPSLAAKLDLNSLWRADTPGLARPKPGVKLTPTEQQVLDHFGKQLNRDQISQFMVAYGAGDPAKSWGFIAKQVEPMLGLKQQASLQAKQQAASQAAQETVQASSGGGAGRGVPRAPENPPVGTVRGGYRYVGGGPGKPFDGNQEGVWQPMESP